MFCNSTVLPVRGGETISARWPLRWANDVDDAAERSFLVDLMLIFNVRPIKRRQIVEIDIVACFSGSSKLIVLTLSSAK